MNYTKSLVGVLAALAVSSCMFGQSNPAVGSNAGLLGQRYAGAGLLVEDFRDSPLANGLGPELVVNLPVAPKVDLAFAYNYERSSNASYKLKEQAIGATVRAYNPYEGVRLFSDATVGHAWVKARALGTRWSEDEAFWALGVGVEAPVGPSTALVGRIAYNDLFSSGDNGTWTFTGGVNHWFTPQVFGTASVTLVEKDAVVYGVGLGLRF